MPHPVASIFGAVGLTPFGFTPWGTPPQCKDMGVYVVALTDDPNSLVGSVKSLPASKDAIANWIRERPDLMVDDVPASVDSLRARLGRYWLPEEVALYIGKTEKEDGLCGRVKQFYSHILGRSSPHRGGQWIKTLSLLTVAQ